MDVIKEGATVLLDHWIMTSVTALTLFLTFDYINTFSELKRLGLKGPTPWPILGNLGPMIFDSRGLHIYFQDLIKQYGNLFGIYFLKIPSYVVYDPELNKEILVKEFDKFHDIPTTDMEKGEPVASMITSLNGERWRRVRRILTPTFSSGRMKEMIFIMHEAADTLLCKMEKAAEEDKAFDIHEWQQALTMEVILSTSFGVKTNAQTDPDDHLMNLARKSLGTGVFMVLISMIPLVGGWLSRKLANTRFGLSTNALADVAKKIIEERKANESQRKDLLNLMLAAQDPDNYGHKMTEQEVVAQMIAFILVGYDTSSNVLALTCYHLAIYPEIQEKVFEEIKDVCSLPDTCTYDEIHQMPYLEACISETLRLYPPGFITARKVTESCTIKGIFFKKGLSVLFPIYALHHDEEFFPDPESFKPERFLPENKGSINQNAYMPFGMGPRNCTGLRFAMLEMKVILARILQKYRLVRGPETPFPIKVKPKYVLSPPEPVMIRAGKRD